MTALPYDLAMSTPGSKRAAAIRSDELALGSTAYKPPAMRSGPRGAGLASALPDHGTADTSRVSGGTKYDASYRRTRAGTLPTDLGDSSRAAPPASGDYLSGRAVGSASAYTSRSGAATPIDEAHQAASSRSAFTLPPRPGLRHAASSSVALLSSEAAANRIRSGSLTLPSEDVGKAFGSSAFSSAWLANPGLSSGSASRTGRHKFMSSTSSNAEDSKSASSNDITPGDELGNFSTLDYLGLEAVDTPKQATFFPPASMTDLRSQAQQNIAKNGPSSRHRASTVSAMARPHYKSSSSYSDLIAAATDERGRLHGGDDYGSTSGYQYTDSGISSDDPYNMGMAVAKGFKDDNLLNALSSRPRATTIGMLDGKPRGGMRGSSAFQSGLGGVSQASREETGTYQRNDKEFAAMHRAIAPRHGLSASISSRTSTPDGIGRERESGATQGQLPTRSLWLGNLDVTTTAPELMAVFAPYGAIESLRLLPEKSCAFVNFIDKADAVRAKDDVLIRLGGHIRELSDTPVRVGFGKIDSVPTAAPTASTMQYSLSNSSLSSLASGLSENGDPHSPKKEKAKVPSSASPELLDQPTRALWIGSIPAATTPGTLLSIFSPFGAVESARVLTNKQCGFVNFETIPSAIAARTALNGREILGSDVGAVKIGFAKIPVKGSPTTEQSGPDNPSSSREGGSGAAGLMSALKDLKGRSGLGDVPAGGMENYSSNLVLDLLQKGVHDDVKAFKRPASVAGSATSSTRELASENGITEQQMIMMVLSDGDASMEEDVLAVAHEGDPDHPALYYSYIPAMAERHQMRRFDAMALKDLRKRLDSGALEQHEVDQIATDLLEDCVDLSSDYIGNCLIQRLFEQANPELRLAMLERIAPHLALIGTHKNGTWAAQKIIECSNTPTELAIISQNLQPYCPPLCADQFGNYVVSMCLRFGEPSNRFIFDAMVDRVWDIAQTRFGARCMRTCLESTHTTHFQKKRIAAAIVLHSIPLATNPNGALLLTWLVDASELPGRYSLLAPRFAPYLPHLATHKLASLTILRIVNQSTEPEAATTILDALFKSPEDRVLHEILQDQVHGCHTVAKIVTGVVLPADDKSEYIEACKRVLSTMRVSSSLAYRKLLEVCGLPITSGPPGGGGNSRYQGPGANANGRSPNAPPRSGSAYPSGLGRGGYRSQHSSGPGSGPGPSHAHGYHPEPAYPSAQEMAMNSMMNSMQAFQLGQGMANQGGLSPIVIPGPGQGLGAGHGQGQSFGQMIQGHGGLSPAPMSPTPTLGSFATPHASMMSPNSDPFNPFASPSQLPRNNAIHFGNPARDEAPPFQLSPSFGGLGMQPADGPGSAPGYYPFVQNPQAQEGFNRNGGQK